jgi:long-chain acyl-CoA synthetase
VEVNNKFFAHWQARMTQNICGLLEDASERSPERPFFFFRGNPFSYSLCMERVRRLSAWMEGRRIGPGDRVLLNAGNSPDFICALFAVLQLGAIAVLANPAYRGYELEYLIAETSPSLIVTLPELMINFMAGGRMTALPDSILYTGADGPSPCIGEVCAGSARRTRIESVDPRHPAVIIFTSAMSGYPLGALISHGAILETARAARQFLVEDGTSFLSALPLFHSFGLTTTLFIPLFSRVPLYLLDRFSPRTVFDLIQNGSVDIMTGVPRMYELLQRVIPPGTRFTGMRAWISGGEAISASLQREFLNSFGIDIRQGYGLTEASPIVTWNMPDKPNVFGSIGTEMPYNRVKIVDSAGNELPDSRPGEIMVRGINVISGYYKQDDATRQSFIDGWIKTGDLGVRDEHGCYRIRGRLKKMVIRNGFNVYPAEVERILAHHPMVEKVVVNASFDLDPVDNTFREKTEALVYRRKGATLDDEGFMSWCKSNICPYKIPDRITVVD